MRFGIKPLQGGSHFAATLEECALAERLGFDSVYISEHHGLPDGFYPAPLLIAAAVAAGTRRVRLWIGILILPLYHPLHVAEQAAVLDGLSGGRLELGVAVGYRPEEFAAFGVPLQERGPRTDEAIPLIRRLLQEENVTHQGRFWQLRDFTVYPRPVQRPMRIWVGGWSAPALRRAARLGDGWLPGPTANRDTLRRCFAVYRNALRERETGPHTMEQPLGRDLYITTDRAERDHVMRLFTERYARAYVQWGHFNTPATEFQAPPERGDRFFAGDPDECIAYIKDLQAEFGITQFLTRMHYPEIGPTGARRSMELFAAHVIPAFQG
ncbi:MAG TPA: LLM class flavin-dependent oxidoreductase [Candidatus Methylomirabilis sp.]|jgi:probable F420-dependent oxidoreductase